MALSSALRSPSAIKSGPSVKNHIVTSAKGYQEFSKQINNKSGKTVLESIISMFQGSDTVEASKPVETKTTTPVQNVVVLAGSDDLPTQLPSPCAPSTLLHGLPRFAVVSGTYEIKCDICSNSEKTSVAVSNERPSIASNLIAAAISQLPAPNSQGKETAESVRDEKFACKYDFSLATDQPLIVHRTLPSSSGILYELPQISFLEETAEPSSESDGFVKVQSHTTAQETFMPATEEPCAEAVPDSMSVVFDTVVPETPSMSSVQQTATSTPPLNSDYHSLVKNLSFNNRSGRSVLNSLLTIYNNEGTEPAAETKSFTQETSEPGVEAQSYRASETAEPTPEPDHIVERMASVTGFSDSLKPAAESPTMSINASPQGDGSNSGSSVLSSLVQMYQSSGISPLVSMYEDMETAETEPTSKDKVAADSKHNASNHTEDKHSEKTTAPNADYEELAKALHNRSGKSILDSILTRYQNEPAPAVSTKSSAVDETAEPAAESGVSDRAPVQKVSAPLGTTNTTTMDFVPAEPDPEPVSDEAAIANDEDYQSLVDDMIQKAEILLSKGLSRQTVLDALLCKYQSNEPLYTRLRASLNKSFSDDVASQPIPAPQPQTIVEPEVAAAEQPSEPKESSSSYNDDAKKSYWENIFNFNQTSASQFDLSLFQKILDRDIHTVGPAYQDLIKDISHKAGKMLSYGFSIESALDTILHKYQNEEPLYSVVKEFLAKAVSATEKEQKRSLEATNYDQMRPEMAPERSISAEDRQTALDLSGTNWEVTVTFKRSNSKNFSKALEILEYGDYETFEDEDGKEVYQAIYNSSDLGNFFKLIDIVGRWKTTSFKINNTTVDFTTIEAIRQSPEIRKKYPDAKATNFHYNPTDPNEFATH